MFAERIYLEISIALDDIDHHRPPCHNVSLLRLVIEMYEGADDIGAESVKFCQFVDVFDLGHGRTYGIRAPSVSALAILRSSPSS